MADSKEIKDSLIKQLQNKGADVSHFLGLVDDYVWYFEQEKAMQQDINTRGRVYTAISAAGKTYEKENPSIKNAVMYNKQKIAILKQLELTTDNVINDDDDEL